MSSKIVFLHMGHTQHGRNLDEYVDIFFYVKIVVSQWEMDKCVCNFQTL